MNSFSFNLSLPCVRESSPQVKVTAPDAVFALLKDMTKLAQECFIVLTVNTKNRLIDKHLVTLGIVDAGIAHPREVFRPAIADGATSIIVAHNHPSGDTTPSREDLSITRQLIEAGKILGIRVLDHVIIGEGFTSLREQALCSFE